LAGKNIFLWGRGIIMRGGKMIRGDEGGGRGGMAKPYSLMMYLVILLLDDFLSDL